MSNQIIVPVVEDEPIVRFDIVEELRDRGLDVLEAATATEALSILSSLTTVDVLFTDVDMPGDINGLELAKVVDERWPPIQIVVASGRRRVGKADLPGKG